MRHFIFKFIKFAICQKWKGKKWIEIEQMNKMKIKFWCQNYNKEHDYWLISIFISLTLLLIRMTVKRTLNLNLNRKLMLIKFNLFNFLIEHWTIRKMMFCVWWLFGSSDLHLKLFLFDFIVEFARWKISDFKNGHKHNIDSANGNPMKFSKSFFSR